MKRFIFPILLLTLFLSGCGLAPTVTEVPQTMPQIGLNFIWVFSGLPKDAGRGTVDTTTKTTQPSTIFNDFTELGVQTFRQLTKADVAWDVVEPKQGEWHFTETDAVIMHTTQIPIVTLFTLQYASPNPPWASEKAVFNKQLTAETEEYITTVVDRYKDYVTYWEIGNEMDRWRSSDKFSPEEQGVFLAAVSDLIRAHDPKAVIVLPGISGLSEYTLQTWLPGVIKGGGTDWFDIVNYHYYSSWQKYSVGRAMLDAAILDLGLSNKPVWLTETGSTSSATLTKRTNYPNTPESQAADVFRRIIGAYAAGDSLVLWHTYLSSQTTDWSDYGLLSPLGNKKPSYFTFQLLVQELLPFRTVETIEKNPVGRNIYKITTEGGALKYVAWGSGDWSIPEGTTTMTSVMPSANGNYTWADVPSTIPLSATPILVK